MYESSSDSEEEKERGTATTGAKILSKPSYAFTKAISKAFESTPNMGAKKVERTKKKASMWDVPAENRKGSKSKSSPSSGAGGSTKSSSSSSKASSSSKSSSSSSSNSSRSKSYSRRRSKSPPRSHKTQSSKMVAPLGEVGVVSLSNRTSGASYTRFS